jgi:hypothetical protein
LTPIDTIEVHDLISGERYYWRGASNYVRLEPESRVAHILQVRLPRPLPELPALPNER